MWKGGGGRQYPAVSAGGREADQVSQIHALLFLSPSRMSSPKPLQRNIMSFMPV